MPNRRGERAAAIENGEEFYFTGKPCKHGHIAKRSVKTRMCEECSIILIERLKKYSLEKYHLKRKQSMSPDKRKSARSVAIARGETVYMPSEPCKRGHMSLRHYRDGCIECREMEVAAKRIKKIIKPVDQSQNTITSLANIESGKVYFVKGRAGL